MRVAIVHHQYAKKGGMESYLFDLVSEFIRRNDDVTVFTCKIDPDCLIEPALKVVKYSLRWCPRKYRKFLFISHINKKFNQLDFDLSLNLTRTASQNISVCGGTHHGFLKAMGKRTKFKDRLEIYYEQKSFDESPYVIAHSEMVADEITQFYHIEQKKIHLICPPVSTEKFSYPLEEQVELHKKKFNIAPNKTSLLFPSTGHKRKGLFELLDAMKQLPNTEFELLVAGDAIKNSMPFENVRYLGYVNNMAELYAAVDFTILPSHYEPFGLVAIESIQCGTPVILSSYVGAKQLLSEAEGIVFPGAITADNIAVAIKKAQQKKFEIAPDFVQRKSLTTEAHINKIIALRYS